MADAPTPLLSMQGINKSFLGVPALTDAHLEVARGEVHALIGQNGAGKSTLIKVLTGVLPTDAGRIEFAGAEVAFHLAARRRNGPACPPSTRRSTWSPSGRWPRTSSSTGSPRVRPHRLGPDEPRGGRHPATARHRRRRHAAPVRVPHRTPSR